MSVPPPGDRLTHFDAEGRAVMVDVGAKPVTDRSATARARVEMLPATLAMIRAGSARKGDVLGVARLAGIMAAKRTAELIPLCHPLLITAVTVDLEAVGDTSVEIAATVRTTGQTGVEMEALTAASVAALTVYDMIKSADRFVTITNVRLLEKSGGKSGHWKRPAAGESKTVRDSDGGKGSRAVRRARVPRKGGA